MTNNYQNTLQQIIKKVLFSLTLSLIGYGGYSQVSFGVKSGINIATTKGLLAFPKNRLGWYAGGFATIPLHKKFFLHTELLYSSKGNGEEYNVNNAAFIFNYINVPLLLGYNIDHKTSIFLGPEFGYLTSAQMKYKDGYINNVSKNYSPKFDAGLDIGLNYKIIKKLGIEVRYNYGFKILYYIDGAGVRHDETKGANRVFQVGLNYSFK